MARTNRSSHPPACFAALTLALILSAALPYGAGAQEVPRSFGDPTFGNPTIGTSPFGDDLRGTEAATPDADAPPADGTPDQPQVVRPGLRSTVAPERSTAKRRNGPPRLPVLRPYPTAAQPKPRGAAIDTLDSATLSPAAPGPAVGPTVAALPVTTIRRPVVDPTPFAPIGYDLGLLRLTPFVEQSLGYDTNPDQIGVAVKPSAFSRSEGGFDLLSLWSGNQLRANMHAGYDEFFSNPSANRPDAAGTVDYRYDITRDLGVDAEGRFVVATQRPGSPELNVAVRERPLISSFGTTLGGTDTMGRLTLGLHGTFDRTQYENGVLPDGTIVRLGDQTFNTYGITARADYELTPVLRPFAEITGDTRVHDLRTDFSGYARDSDGVSGRIGTTFEFTHLITGTVSAGYGQRSYDDPRLRDLRGPLVDAALAYAVTPLTTLSLTASTSFNETTVIGSSGSESRSVAFQVSHALLRNLTLTGIVGYLNTTYEGSPIVENTISGTLRASYALSRSLVLDATYNHQTLNSTIPLSSFTQDVFLVGLRAQH